MSLAFSYRAVLNFTDENFGTECTDARGAHLNFDFDLAGWWWSSEFSPRQVVTVNVSCTSNGSERRSLIRSDHYSCLSENNRGISWNYRGDVRSPRTKKISTVQVLFCSGIKGYFPVLWAPRTATSACFWQFWQLKWCLNIWTTVIPISKRHYNIDQSRCLFCRMVHLFNAAINFSSLKNFCKNIAVVIRIIVVQVLHLCWIIFPLLQKYIFSILFSPSYFFFWFLSSLLSHFVQVGRSSLYLNCWSFHIQSTLL